MKGGIFVSQACPLCCFRCLHLSAPLFEPQCGYIKRFERFVNQSSISNTSPRNWHQTLSVVHHLLWLMCFFIDDRAGDTLIRNLAVTSYFRLKLKLWLSLKWRSLIEFTQFCLIHHHCKESFLHPSDIVFRTFTAFTCTPPGKMNCWKGGSCIHRSDYLMSFSNGRPHDKKRGCGLDPG